MNKIGRSTLSSILKRQLVGSLKMNCSSLKNIKQQNIINHRFAYGQAGTIDLTLKNRIYNISVQTIWQDYSSLSYSGLNGAHSFFVTQPSQGNIKFDDNDLLNLNQVLPIHIKIPQDFTMQGKINGNIKQVKSTVSTKTRSNSYEIQILGKDNTYQWINMQCQQAKIINRDGVVRIGTLTVRDFQTKAKEFYCKKLLFSGQVNLEANQIQSRSIIAYKDATVKIQNANQVYVESLSGKCQFSAIKQLTIDRLLSCTNGINIRTDQIDRHIIIQTGSGVIQCLRKSKQILKQKIKLGKMHKGRLDFDSLNAESDSLYSRVKIIN